MPGTTSSSSRPQVLLTGFEPFLTHARNPSEEVARFTAEELDALGVQALAITLPVTYACAEEFLAQNISSPHQLLIHVGLADRRAHISLEERAFNRHGTTLDNLSVTPPTERGGKLDSRHGAPPELVTALDIVALRDSLNALLEDEATGEEVLPEAHITQDAGDYVCNAIYYHSLHEHPRSLFVHVPHLSPEQTRKLGAALASAIVETLLDVTP